MAATKPNQPEIQNRFGATSAEYQHPLVRDFIRELRRGTVVLTDHEWKALERINRELMRPQLWGASEVAERLGVALPNVYKLAKQGLPAPAVELNRGKLWSAHEIREFAKKRRRRAARKEQQ